MYCCLGYVSPLQLVIIALVNLRWRSFIHNVSFFGVVLYFFGSNWCGTFGIIDIETCKSYIHMQKGNSAVLYVHTNIPMLWLLYVLLEDITKASFFVCWHA